MKKNFKKYMFVLVIALFLFVNKIYAVNCSGSNGLASGVDDIVIGVSLYDPDRSASYGSTWCGPYFVNINKSTDIKKIDEADVNKEVIYFNIDTKQVNLINSVYTGTDSDEYFKKKIGTYESSSKECPAYIKKNGDKYSDTNESTDADYFSAQDSVKVCSYDFMYLAFYQVNVGDYKFFRVYTNTIQNTRIGVYSQWKDFNANKCPTIYRVYSNDVNYLYSSKNVSNVVGSFEALDFGVLQGIQTFDIENYEKVFSRCNSYTDLEQQNECKMQANNDFESALRDYSSYCNQVYSSCNYNDKALVSCLATDRLITQFKKEYGLKGGSCGLSSNLINWIANIFKWVKYIAPVVAIILGMLDFIKAVASQNDDDMKKAQGKFIKRLIAAALLFIIPFIIEFVLDKFHIGTNGFCNLNG